MILLVEDNKKILEGNALKFTREGYEVACALTLADARNIINKKQPDIIVLDIGLPDGSGLDFIKEVREKAAIPVLFLTGLATPNDIIQGLSVGGDDYLTKPYNFDELFARVEAVIRRCTTFPEIISKGDLSIDITAGIVKHKGNDLLLTKKEYALLLIFIQNEERFVKADHLYEKVWGAPMESDNNALKGAIKRLRTKLDSCGWSIGWTRGEGYIFEKK